MALCRCANSVKVCCGREGVRCFVRCWWSWSLATRSGVSVTPTRTWESCGTARSRTQSVCVCAGEGCGLHGGVVQRGSGERRAANVCVCHLLRAGENPAFVVFLFLQGGERLFCEQHKVNSIEDRNVYRRRNVCAFTMDCSNASHGSHVWKAMKTHGM